MAMIPLDAWPDIELDVETPRQILLRYAKALYIKSKGHLKADFDTAESPEGTRTLHSFKIMADELRYTYELFTVAHGVHDLYPADVKFGPWVEAARREWRKKRTGRDEPDGSVNLTTALVPALAILPGIIDMITAPAGTVSATTPLKLEQLVGEILSSDLTRSVLSSLLARLNEKRHYELTEVEDTSVDPPPNA